MRAATLPRITLAALVLMIGLSVFYSPPAVFAGASLESTGEATPVKKILTIERIFATPSLTGSGPSNIHWLPDGSRISYIEDTNDETHLVVREIPSGKKRTLCIADTIAVPADLAEPEEDHFSFGDYRWSETGDLMLIQFRDEIFTFDAKTGEVIRRTHNDASEENTVLSPDASKIAFTRDNDIWMVDLDTNQETRFTTGGSDTLFNGVLDYVYMEELFTRGDVQAYWWSPDSEKIAYLQFDESAIPEFPIVDYIPVHNTAEMQRYPLPGDPAPIVRVGVIDIETGETKWMNVDTTDDSYIARLYWVGDGNHLAIEKLNRAQDELSLLFADSETGDVRELFADTSQAWITPTYIKHYYKTKDLFVWSSDRDGFLHLYLYKNDGTLVRQLTEGDWTVYALNGVDEKKGHIFFSGLKESILERHLYRTTEKGGSPKRITKRPGTHTITMSPDNEYYIDQFSSTTTPRVITVHEADGKTLFTLDEADVTELREYNLPQPEFFTITSDEGHDLYCSMLKPVDFDPSRKYPVIVYTYAYPNGQVVRNIWGRMLYLWHSMMTQRGYIVFSLDNRGSFGRGKAWEEAALKTMGQLELDDQVAGAKYLGSLPYVDGSRIGIWGWSGGGSMAAMAMLKAPGVFKAGAAVAPVTDWRYYDLIYTERYMKRPQDNEDGYYESSPANFASNLQGAFFLAHGTSDDNVHAQNAMVLASELINAGKDFDLMLYPRGRHGIGGNTARAHLFTKMTRFFEENL